MTTTTEGDVARLAELVSGIRFAMVVLPAADGALRGRPLTTQEIEDDGSLWFMVSRTSDWAEALSGATPGNAVYADPDDQRWVSVSGTATLVDDRARIEAMWNPMYAAWFDSADDPDITLLRIDADTADYWDADANAIVRWVRMAKAVLTDARPDVGERGELHPGA